MWEPNLFPMSVQFAGGYSETFYAYKIPDVSTFYNHTAGSKKPTVLQFTGQIIKFINMAPYPIQIYWISSSTGSVLSSTVQHMFITEIEPFGSAATASYPKHTFLISNTSDPTRVIAKHQIDASNSLYYYDPYNFNIKTAKNSKLNDEQLHMYHIQLVNRAFAYQYKLFTGIDWLALYKHRHPPR
jgi:hypothetical protein